MIEWGQKLKPKKIPGATNKTEKKSMDQKLTSKKSHGEFSSLKNSQKALNYITRCSLFGYTLFAELRGRDTQEKFRNRKFQTHKDPLIIPVT